MSEKIYEPCGVCYRIKYYFNTERHKEPIQYSKCCKKHQRKAEAQNALQELSKLSQELKKDE